MRDEWSHSVGRERILCMTALRNINNLGVSSIDGLLCGTDTGQIEFVSLKDGSRRMVGTEMIR